MRFQHLQVVAENGRKIGYPPRERIVLEGRPIRGPLHVLAELAWVSLGEKEDPGPGFGIRGAGIRLKLPVGAEQVDEVSRLAP